MLGTEFLTLNNNYTIKLNYKLLVIYFVKYSIKPYFSMRNILFTICAAWYSFIRNQALIKKLSKNIKCMSRQTIREIHSFNFPTEFPRNSFLMLKNENWLNFLKIFFSYIDFPTNIWYFPLNCSKFVFFTKLKIVLS